MIAVLMLVVLVVAAVLVARGERERQQQASWARLFGDMTTEIDKVARAMGEQLLPAMRAVIKAFDDFGRAMLKDGATKWK